MSAQENVNEVMKFLFTVQLINKMYHLNTTSFARHKASDGFDESLQSHIDRFAETYIGRYKVKPVVTSLKIDQEYLSDEGMEKLFIQVRKYLENINRLFVDPDLLAIRDDLLADVNKTLYLFQLK
jgi:DNA-binding ferritin-like protein